MDSTKSTISMKRSIADSRPYHSSGHKWLIFTLTKQSRWYWDFDCRSTRAITQEGNELGETLALGEKGIRNERESCL